MPNTVIEIMVADWEIECCAPPPVIGAESAWRLVFFGAADELAHENIWTVTHQDGGDVMVDRDGFHAVWNTYAAPPPPPGIHRLRGSLHGTAHGGIVPDDLPPVSGRVQRIRLASYEFEWDPAEERTLRPVPATLIMHDVRESPRRFDCGPIGPGRQNTGVLIDLAVRPSPHR